MSQFMTLAAGDKPTAQQIMDLVPLWAEKSADESVTSSTTLQNDDHLSLPVAANTTYQLTMWVVVFSAAEAPDFKAAFTLPTGATADFSINGIGFATTGTVVASVQMQALLAQTSPTTTQSTGAVGDNTINNVGGRIVVGATAGTLQFQWAQATSNATAVSVRKGSWMKLERVL